MEENRNVWSIVPPEQMHHTGVIRHSEKMNIANKPFRISLHDEHPICSVDSQQQSGNIFGSKDLYKHLTVAWIIINVNNHCLLSLKVMKPLSIQLLLLDDD